MLRIYSKGKIIHLHAQTGLSRYRRLGFVEFMDNQHIKVVTLSALRTAQFYSPTPGRYHWYSFPLEAELNLVQQCCRKDYVNEKFQRHNRKSDHSYRGVLSNMVRRCVGYRSPKNLEAIARVGPTQPQEKIIVTSITTFRCIIDRLCGLVVRVSGYRYRGPGFDPRRYQIF